MASEAKAAEVGQRRRTAARNGRKRSPFASNTQPHDPDESPYLLPLPGGRRFPSSLALLRAGLSCPPVGGLPAGNDKANSHQVGASRRPGERARGRVAV